MEQELRVHIYSGYNNGVKCSVYLGDEEHLIDVEDIEALITEKVAKGKFTTEKTNRQKYPRIKLK